MEKFSGQDRFFMQRALELAAKGVGKTAPNPIVGAVLVRSGKIVAEGYHRSFGKPHAEVEALQKISLQQLKDSILYLTLEPCSHHGKTPPCVDFLIRKRVQHVVIASEDPNPLVHGKGIKKLRKAGVKIQTGLLVQEAEHLNEVFYHAMRKKSSFVLVKMAMTLDGKIAPESGHSSWISNEQSRRKVHRMRSHTQAILTTAQTVLADDPHLGVRMVKGHDPLRIILDRKLITPVNAQVYRDQNVLVVTTRTSAVKQRKAFAKASIPLLVYPGEHIPLQKLFKNLFDRNIHEVMVEAGSALFTSLLQEKLVNKVVFFIAPVMLGKGVPVLGDLGIDRMDKALKLKDITLQRFGDDIMVAGYPIYR